MEKLINTVVHSIIKRLHHHTTQTTLPLPYPYPLCLRRVFGMLRYILWCHGYYFRPGLGFLGLRLPGTIGTF